MSYNYWKTLFWKNKKKNVDKYLGSGKYWKYHINKHWKQHVVTLWSDTFNSFEELTNFTTTFSIKLSKSKSGANHPQFGKCRTSEERKNFIGLKRSQII
jgi:hypothetical protein